MRGRGRVEDKGVGKASLIISVLLSAKLQREGRNCGELRDRPAIAAPPRRSASPHDPPRCNGAPLRQHSAADAPRCGCAPLRPRPALRLRLAAAAPILRPRLAASPPRSRCSCAQLRPRPAAAAPSCISAPLRPQPAAAATRWARQLRFPWARRRLQWRHRYLAIHTAVAPLYWSGSMLTTTQISRLAKADWPLVGFCSPKAD